MQSGFRADGRPCKNATGEEWETDDNNNIIWGSEEESVNGAKSRLAYQKQNALFK